jgi:hypothetical protein
MIDRRRFLNAGVGVGLGIGCGLIRPRLLVGKSVVSSPVATPLSLTADEIAFLHSGLMHQTENEARRLMRIHQVRIPQLSFLAHVGGANIWEDSSATKPVNWPWKSRHEFDHRLKEAHECHRRSRPSQQDFAVESLRYVGFRPDEISFLLCWLQEYTDWCLSYEEWGKDLRYHPTLRLVRNSLPGVGMGYIPMMPFSLALCDELGLNPNFDGPALPLDNVHPPLPWKAIEELGRRQRDVAAYEVRKDKATNVSHTWWPRQPLDFNRQELAFLDAWLQERLQEWPRGKPGPAHGEQTARGVWNAQLMNLVWASNLEIEPRANLSVSWPWPTLDEFNRRLRVAADSLYKRAQFRPQPAIAFRPDEERFVVAWIQESEGRQTVSYDEPRPVLDLVLAHVPELIEERPRTKWCEHNWIANAWLKTKGLHRLAVAGGPCSEGPLVYPWKDRAEFEARVRDAGMINHAS